MVRFNPRPFPVTTVFERIKVIRQATGEFINELLLGLRVAGLGVSGMHRPGVLSHEQGLVEMLPLGQVNAATPDGRVLIGGQVLEVVRLAKRVQGGPMLDGAPPIIVVANRFDQMKPSFRRQCGRATPSFGQLGTVGSMISLADKDQGIVALRQDEHFSDQLEKEWDWLHRNRDAAPIKFTTVPIFHLHVQ